MKSKEEVKLEPDEIVEIEVAVGPKPSDQDAYHWHVRELHALGNAFLLLKRYGFSIAPPESRED